MQEVYFLVTKILFISNGKQVNWKQDIENILWVLDNKFFYRFSPFAGRFKSISGLDLTRGLPFE